jgi:NAD(P)-dependent dehydrogenase (short-subunit alcohol dehydrogenase family)
MDEPKQEIGITSKSMQKVATVTGAARGIGLGTVKRFLVEWLARRLAGHR